MTSRPVPLPDGAYADSARSFVDQDALNMIRVNAEAPGTRSPYLWKTVPGLLPICAVADISRQRGGYVCEGRLLVVMDQTLLQVATSGIVSVLGTIPGNGRVSFSHNQIPNGNEVLITNGTQGFIYSTVAGTLTQITDSGFLGGLLSAFIGNRFLTLDPARRRFQNSELADGLNWNSSEFYLGESSPDRIRSLAVLNNEVVLLNESTIEHFAYTGTTNALFENKGISIGRGCASTYAVSVLDNALLLIGDDYSGYEKRGYELRRITSHAIEQAWAKNDASKAFSFVWEDRGHKVWYVTFPVGDEAGTWGFDVATRTWHRRESYGMHRWRPAWLAKWNGEWVAGEYNGGRIFKLDWDYPLEGSDCLSREGAFGVLHNNGNPMSLHALKLTVEAGPSVEAVSVEPQTPIVPFDTLVESLSPIAWWKMEDSGSTAAEEIAGRDGTYSGAITHNSRRLRTGGGMVAKFTSKTGSVSIPASSAIAFDSLQPFSAHAWYRLDTFAGMGANNALIFTMFDNANAGRVNFCLSLIKEAESDYRPAGYYTIPGPVNYVTEAAGTTDLNATHLLAFTYDPDASPRLILYVDGVEVDTAILDTSAPVASSSVFIGGDGTYPDNYGFVGWIGDVTLYRAALTPEQVAQLYSTGALA